jgi:DNA-binding IclR family transcriptional regulator
MRDLHFLGLLLDLRFRSVLIAIEEREITPTEIVKETGLPRPQVLRVLMKLKQIGLLRSRSTGRITRYRVNSQWLRNT